MKHTKKFCFDTEIVDKYAKPSPKIIGFARVSGVGYWDAKYQSDWDNKECELEDIASFDVENVRFNKHGEIVDLTFAYSNELLSDTVIDQIKAATLAHLEYLFSVEDTTSCCEETSQQEYDRTEFEYIRDKWHSDNVNTQDMRNGDGC